MINLFNRLNSLSEGYQAYILASVYGMLEAKSYEGDKTAVEVLEMIENKVNRVEEMK